MKMDAVEFAERLTEAMAMIDGALTKAQADAMLVTLIRWSHAREAGNATYSVSVPEIAAFDSHRPHI